MLNIDDLVNHMGGRKTPAGDLYLKQFRHLMAASLYTERRRGSTLYNEDLNFRLAAALWSFDTKLHNRFLGDFDLVGRPYHEVWNHIEDALDGKPRGAWLRVKHLNETLAGGNGYDVFMSDGLGGIATRSGYKFMSNRIEDPRFGFLRQYGDLLSSPAYLARRGIAEEIAAHSVAQSDLAGGSRAKGVHFNRARWNIEIIDMRSGGHAMIQATRRGVAGRKVFELKPESVMAFFSDRVPMVVPDDLLEAGCGLPASGRHQIMLADLSTMSLDEVATSEFTRGGLTSSTVPALEVEVLIRDAVGKQMEVDLERPEMDLQILQKVVSDAGLPVDVAESIAPLAQRTLDADLSIAWEPGTPWWKTSAEGDQASLREIVPEPGA